jgi:hypothetical protein
VSEREK